MLIKRANIYNMTNQISIWKRLRRTPYQSIATFFMMFVTLFVLGLFLLLVAGSTSLLSYFESKPQLTVFLKNDASKETIDALSEKIK